MKAAYIALAIVYTLWLWLGVGMDPVLIAANWAAGVWLLLLWSLIRSRRRA
jgi:hypothetical protein